ncbi:MULTISPECIES: hypothetical protein [Hymenobacter]|uniref:DUF4468 domain-containing protein n=1 Tax=Hymenobacter armeniacus TaxID=2771358 RepID=A0ABR8JTN7_9BACT|nr:MULTISPECIES: hypothetical protein [Hymenobacter]MBD2723336.1 hypothetical protein [Hymenobacter armeniacus]MBJ6108636.1 hypothetical protein [Hymenobacter sp. BT523]
MQKVYFLLLLLAGWLAPALASAQLYDVRPGEVNYNKKPRPALKVQVDGKATDVREFFQDWMKSSYNVKFKTGGVLGMGKSDVLMAKQTPASTISGKLVDLYATVIAPSDSVSEVSLFGGFDDNTFFDPDKTATEYNALRAIAQNFAGAARLKAYRDMIAEAEKKLKAVEKEKERLEKEQAYLKTNTEANLARIEELKKKNAENLLQSRADSAAQTKNRVLLDESRLRLQRRRDRLSALDRKN